MNSPNGLPVLTFGDGPQQAIAVHGITASTIVLADRFAARVAHHIEEGEAP
jgi:hypothetical protein